MRSVLLGFACAALFGCAQNFDFKGEDVKVQNQISTRLTGLKAAGDTPADMQMYTGTACMAIRDEMSSGKHIKCEVSAVPVGPKQIAVTIRYDKDKPYPSETEAFVRKVVAGMKSPFQLEIVMGRIGTQDLMGVSERNRVFSGL